MTFSLSDREIEFKCPKCNASITVKVKEIGSTIACPHCKQNIHLTDDGFSESAHAAEKSINDLIDKLGHLGS